MTFARLLSEADAGIDLPGTGDVLAVGLPLLRQMADLHRSGMVTRLDGVAHYAYVDGELTVDSAMVQRPSPSSPAVERINAARSRSGVAVVDKRSIDWDRSGQPTSQNLDVILDPTAQPDRPVLVVGYRAWEQWFDHHDQLTDIHLAGLVLSSYCTALDLDVATDIGELADERRHLLRLNRSLHPVVAGVLSEMIDPDRRRRPQDLDTVIARLEHHRSLAGGLDLDEAYTTAESGPRTWQTEVLRTLRDRVFDLTRRNRAIYFRPTAASVGLTEASVPVLLDIARIKPEDLLTWNDTAAAGLASGKPVNLAKWCRFEEATHVPPALDKLISSERRSRAEYGFGRLKLIAAFLRWVDPETNEVINSPLVLLPATLTRQKGVTPIYRLVCEGEASVNPDLRHLLAVRFGIDLPAIVDPAPDSIRQLVVELERKVQATDPATRIEVVDQPRIRLLRKRAQIRLDAFRKRRARSLANSGRWRRVNHSYDPTDFRPLGLEMYRRFLQREALPLRDIAGANPLPWSLPSAFAATSSVRETTGYSVQESDVNRHRWEVDLCAVTLAQIGSKRTSLVRDYDSLLNGAGDPQTHAPFTSVFSPEARPLGQDRSDEAGIGLDQNLVLPADDAQARAVRRAVDGESFIIQGPPGTGKSQTITNLIAALVGQGQRVLFVCEKRAALDVVSNRLNQVGLGDLTATIHDSQTDRKPFIRERGEVYNDWLDSEPADIETKRSELRQQAEQELRRLTTLESDLNADGIAGRDIIERSVRLRLAGVVPAALSGNPDPANFADNAKTFSDTADTLAGNGRSGLLGDEPMLRFRPGAVQTIAELQTAAKQITELIDSLKSAGVDPAALSTSDLGQASADAVRLAELPAAVQHLGTDVSVSLGEDIQTLAGLTAAIDTATPDIANWRRPLMEPSDARAAYAVANEREGSFLKFLNGQWREVKKAVEAAYDFSAHQIQPSIAAVAGALLTYHDAEAALASFRAQANDRWGTDQLEELQSTLATVVAGPLVDAVGKDFDSAAIAAAGERLQEEIGAVVPAPDETLEGMTTWAGQAGMALPSMQPGLDQWNGALTAQDETLRAARTPNSAVAAIDAAVTERAVQQLQRRLETAGLSGEVIETSIERLLQIHQDLLQANAAAIRTSVQNRFVANVRSSEASKAGKSDADKQAMSSYNAGRKVLENEFRKKMRHKPIRELASGDSGRVVADLAPIWLMSPLSVAETLPLDDGLFDCVVFDEASQIPAEDAVPTLFRAPQVIVVGDRMQLPPTSFFAVESEEDDEVLVDADGHSLILSLDADSFLNQADLNLPSSLLNWHYRSRSEALIAYSNTAFYESRLATIPDRELASESKPPIVVPSGDLSAQFETVTDRPISFHEMTDAVYADRRNEAEADYIARLVRSLIMSDSELTIGVVAFSEAQQTEIEESLAELADDDDQFGLALSAEQDRMDGNEFVGLFVKNLENVQGDERDVIIMSVCYGPDRSGKIRMNFGPINQQGGERRLNVIFSRAKRHMAIVSSIHGSDITNLHNPGAAHLAHFLTYAEAESIGAVEVGAAALAKIPSAVTPDDAAETTSALAGEIAGGLRLRGLMVDERVGRSSFRVDVGIRGDDGYSLGVLIEPALATESSGAARYVAEAGVLEAFDWPIVRVSVLDWLRNPDAVLARIIAASQDAH